MRIKLDRHHRKGYLFQKFGKQFITQFFVFLEHWKILRHFLSLRFLYVETFHYSCACQMNGFVTEIFNGIIILVSAEICFDHEWK